MVGSERTGTSWGDRLAFWITLTPHPPPRVYGTGQIEGRVAKKERAQRRRQRLYANLGKMLGLRRARRLKTRGPKRRFPAPCGPAHSSSLCGARTAVLGPCAAATRNVVIRLGRSRSVIQRRCCASAGARPKVDVRQLRLTRKWLMARRAVLPLGDASFGVAARMPVENFSACDRHRVVHRLWQWRRSSAMCLPHARAPFPAGCAQRPWLAAIRPPS